MVDSDFKALFEKHYLGNNLQVGRKNSTTGDYVVPEIADAWSGWQAAMEYCQANPTLFNKTGE